MNDSYAAARIHVMRTKLLRSQQYEQLMKMGVKEIIGYLQSTEYRQDIDKVSLTDVDNLETIDLVIANNSTREIAKLLRIASPSYLLALNVILRDHDLWNLRIIADAITSGVDPRDALLKYAKLGSFDPLPFATSKSIAELAKAALAKFPRMHRNITTLVEFKDAMQLLAHLPSGANKSTQRYLIDERNILMILMRKRERVAQANILAKLQRGGSITPSLIRSIASASSVEESLKLLSVTKYGKAVAVALQEANSLVLFEEALHSEVLLRIVRESISAPLHAQLLLRYLAEKELEYQNIRLLVKGKKLGLPDTFIRERLAVTA